MRITLTVLEGPHAGKVYDFSKHDTFIVGRSKKAHFRLATKDRYFSRVHFLVEVNPPECRLMDMGSRNGTYVNGEKVQRAALKNGDRIKAGRTVLEVVVRSGDVSGITEPPPGRPEETIDQPGAAPILTAAGSASLLFPQPGPPISAPPSVARTPSVLPLPPSLPAQAAPVPISRPVSVSTGSCRACLAPLPPVNDSQLPWICSTCDAQAVSQDQPIPGYRMIKKLGGGAMGVVTLAVRTSDGQPVAVKTISPAVAGSATQVQRFLREAEILRQLDHPHIVAFRDLGEAEGLLYFAMDHVRGRDAGRTLKKEGPFAIGRAVSLMCQILDGLAYAHARGFVHRDIKPSNVLLTQDSGREVVKLVDFGLARVYQASQLSGLTLTGDIGGTMAFMPPEQITEYREARPPADQYSAAATLYTFLTNAFVHNLPAEFHQQILAILQEPAVPIRERRAEVPDGLAAVIHRALAHEPEDRFPDVSVFRTAILPYAR